MKRKSRRNRNKKECNVPAKKLKATANEQQHDSKTNTNDEKSPTVEKEATENKFVEFVNLNEYCLEHIFNYLELEDLMNVAQTCQYFNRVAHIVFKLKWKDEHSISLRMVKKLERLLSIFGSRLTELNIAYRYKNRIRTVKMNGVNVAMYGMYDDRRHQKINEIFSRYSMESLERITFRRFPKCWFIKFNKPFANVREVRFLDCHLDERFTYLLPILFPKMRNLEFDSCEFIEQIMVQNYSHLKHCDLSLSSSTQLKLEAFITLNPQLEVLKLYSYESLDWRLVEIIAENLTKLHTFILNFPIDLPENSHFHFKNVKIFEFGNFRIYGITSVFPFSFDQLCELTLPYRFDIKLIGNIIKANEKLVKLSCCIPIKYEDYDKNLPESFRKLQELQFDIIDDLEHDKSIERLVFILRQITCVPKITIKASCFAPLKWNEFFLTEKNMWWDAKFDGTGHKYYFGQHTYACCTWVLVSKKLKN